MTPMGQRLHSVRRLGTRAVKKGLRLSIGPTSPVRQNLPEPVKVKLRGVRRRMPQRLVQVIDAKISQAVAKPVSPTLLARGSVRPEPPAEPVRVWIAPANFAGQGRAWARALTEHVDGVGARNMSVQGVIRFETDQEVVTDIYRYPGWQQEQEAYLLENYTHVLIEAERPVLGTRYGSTCEVEIDRFRAAGLSVALISHGSDLRIPSVHAANFAHSPFDDPSERSTSILQARAEQNARIVRDFDGPVFVSTPDLIDYAPQAIWCPTVVELDEWQDDWPVLQRRVPRVVHVPSNGRLKGSEYIDPVLQALADDGRIEYRSLRDLDREELRTEYEQADIVIDQVVMGLYGVASVEAMAAGRVVVGFVGDTVRRRIREATGLEVPIVEAVPETLREVMEGVLNDPDTARAVAARGRGYVRAVHDGRYSASVLTAFTGGEVSLEAQSDGDDVPKLTELSEPSELPPRPVPDLAATTRLMVGPANFAGQGGAWAAAATAHLPGVSARSMCVTGAVHAFPTDYEVPEWALVSGRWGGAQERYLGEYFTHALLESLRPLTGQRFGRRGDGEWGPLRAAGLDLALIAHGSDVRQPSVHRDTTPWSPFRDESWEEVAILEGNAAARRELFAAFDGPTFVSTPDLLDYVPSATWCPVVVDPARWATDAVPLTREGLPVVTHVPSSSRMKGSQLIDPVMAELAEAGVVDYRRAEHVPAERMPALYAGSDIVLDQFALGSYGVAACEAMAASRVVVGHVLPAVREHVREATGLEVPIVEATPDTLADVVRGLLADPDRARERGARGVEFVAHVHDGRRSAEALEGWLLNENR